MKMNLSKQLNDVIMKDQRNEAILFLSLIKIGPVFMILGGFLVSNKFVALWNLFFQNWYRQIILFTQTFINVTVAVGDCNSF